MLLLNIFLWILKFIGIVLLVILGIILLVICLILFVPIRYNINVQYKGEVKVTARITYLLHALRVRFEMVGKESSTDIRALWFKLSGKDDKQQNKREHKKQKKKEPVLTDEDDIEEQRTDTDSILQQDLQPGLPIKSETQIKPETQIQSYTPIQSEVKTQSETDVHRTKDRQPEKRNPKSEKKDKKNKNFHTKDKSGGIMESVKSVVAMLKENRSVLSFLMRQLKALLRHILPGSHVINLKLGLDDPALLGELLGAAAVVRAATNLVINITPVWDEKVLEADCGFKGRILLGKLIFIALRVYFNKDVKKIIHILKN